MIHFEGSKLLFKQLGVNLEKLQIDSLTWFMVEQLHQVVLNATKKVVMFNLVMLV